MKTCLLGRAPQRTITEERAARATRVPPCPARLLVVLFHDPRRDAYNLLPGFVTPHKSEISRVRARLSGLVCTVILAESSSPTVLPRDTGYPVPDTGPFVPAMGRRRSPTFASSRTFGPPFVYPTRLGTVQMTRTESNGESWRAIGR